MKDQTFRFETDEEMGLRIVHEAEVVRKDEKGLEVTLNCSSSTHEIDRRLKGNPGWGEKFFYELKNNGKATLADQHNLTQTPNGANMFIFVKPEYFKDIETFRDAKEAGGYIVMHRRDLGAPTHKFYHAIVGGRASKQDLLCPEGLRGIGLRESAEEQLFLTREEGLILVPENYTSQNMRTVAGTVKKMGLQQRYHRFISCKELHPQDILKVKIDGEELFKLKTNMKFLFNPETTIDTIQVYVLAWDPENVLPMDCEGMEKDGRFIHFGRESFLAPLDSLEGLLFGRPLPDKVKVFRTQKDEQGNYVTQETTDFNYARHKKVEGAYTGPDGIAVIHPQIFAPDDNLVRALGTGLKPWDEYKWLKFERERLKAETEGRTLVPDEFLYKAA